MKTIQNIFINSIKKKYFLSILKKFIKRFEKDTSEEAKKWAESNVKQSTKEFCCAIDSSLYDEVITDIKIIQEEARFKLKKLNVLLGGGGNYILLYFLIRKFKPLNVVETGVAAGWTSLATLRAFKKNGIGFLYSSDFPYFRLKNPEQYIGFLAQDESNKKNWFLDIGGDEVALPKIVKKIGSNEINLIHYDSDKTYSGRVSALRIMDSKINQKTIIIFDDIQDNLHFRDYVTKNKRDYHVFEFEKKFIGVIVPKILD